MKKKILEMIKKGMDLESISLELASEKDFDAETVKSDYDAALKTYEVLQAEVIAKEVEAKKAEVEEAAKQMLDKIPAESLIEKFKSAGVNMGKFNAEYKTYNPANGLIETVKQEESHKAFNDMFYAGMEGDLKSARSISKEIDAENNIVNGICGKAANDPVASDAATRGGYAIPTAVADEINQLTYANSVMLQNMNTDNIIVESKIYPGMYGATVADIADQDTAVTEAQMTFTNPTVAMERAGLYTNISNTIIMQKGNIIPSIITAFGSSFARFLDLRLAVGNVTTQGDLVDGIVFDANTNAPTAFALTALTAAKIEDILNTLSDEASSNVVMIGNRKVRSQIGNLENGAGNKEFPGYVQGGVPLAPFGTPFILNSKIPSTLNISGDARLAGTDDVLIAIDASQVVAGISGSPRIDMSEHWRFTNDVTTIRGITRYGCKVLSSSTGAGTGLGIVAVAQELTN